MEPMIAVHGGAGGKDADSDGPQEAARRGLEAMEDGGSALDAVVEAVARMEDDPRFNAGTGSYMSMGGAIEMDASVMTSAGVFGAVAAIQRVRNPVRVARRVAESPHVLIVGEGATVFARESGFGDHDPTTQKALDKHRQFQEAIEKGEIPAIYPRWKRYLGCDTVGAVAVDADGLFAAANSTGGTSFKMQGRVGDSPILGAGIYAGELGAVVATGIGEEIIMKLLSKQAYDRLGDGGADEACRWGLGLFEATTSVGLIAIDRSSWGRASTGEMPFGAARAGDKG